MRVRMSIVWVAVGVLSIVAVWMQRNLANPTWRFVNDQQHLYRKWQAATMTPAAAGEPTSTAQTTDEDPEMLTYGNSVTRTFTPDATVFHFAFDANAGDVVTLTMVADNGD